MLAMISITAPIMEKYLVISKPLKHADALVVMAGETKVRLPAAAGLYKKGVANKILLTNDGIFSAWSVEKQRNLYEVEWAEEDLLKMRIPVKDIVKLPYTSSGSIYDALNAREFILAKELKSIVVVTSDYHTRRSLWTFEQVFRGYPVNIGVYPAKKRAKPEAFFRRFITLSSEMLKLAYYKTKY
jgi:uncharacterized SAM-binding protein YcdF (DUF218 family)